jgi:hypothetical protein
MVELAELDKNNRSWGKVGDLHFGRQSRVLRAVSNAWQIAWSRDKIYVNGAFDGICSLILLQKSE